MYLDNTRPRHGFGFLCVLVGTLLFLLVGCLDADKVSSGGGTTGGGGGNNGDGDGDGDGGNGPSYTFNNPTTTALQDLVYSFSVGPAPAGTLTITNKPAWANFDAAKGIISGSPTSPGVSKNVTVVYTEGTYSKTLGPFSITVDGDPLAENAWHLANTGQASYSGSKGIAGQDMKARDALQLGYTGKGVKVAVSDTGPEIAHEDLAKGVAAGTSKNYTLPSPYFGDPTTKSNDPGFAHGTAVMGIIGARAWNGMGARGIAPNASLSGLNYLEAQSVASTIDQAGGNYDIFNQSWGPAFEDGDPIRYVPYSADRAVAYRNQLKAGVTTGRANKGVLYVRAAGNDFYQTIITENPFVWTSRSACMEEDNSNTQVLVVGAINAKGLKSSYSSTGSCLWVSATGGEYGYNSAAVNATGNSPAMVTTDLTGCAKGFSNTTATTSDFDRGLAATGNTNCNYTARMNGTSSAAPSTAAVIALMLEANPNLTYRDVKHILATTATQVDAGFAGLIHPLDPVVAGYVNEPPWITNGAGRKFHNWYGFGRINAGAAVQMAKTYVSALGVQKNTLNANGTYKYSSGALTTAIPDNAPLTPATNTIAIPAADDFTIEQIVIEVSVTHTYSGNIGIELKSPAGTKSVMLNTNNAQTTPNLNAVTIVSNAFYGEKAQGNWVISVRDGFNGDVGQLTNWKINIVGR